MRPLHERVEGTLPALREAGLRDLARRLRAKLKKGLDDEALVGDLGSLHRQFDFHPHMDLREGEIGTVFAGEIRPDRTGRVVHFDRAEAQPHIVRDDGAWLAFSITVQQTRSQLVLIAYDFELVFEPEHQPRFVRFDLNAPDHANAEREIRSHVHPGNDDLLLPAPIQTPEELLDLLVWRLRPRDPEAPRAP